MEDLSSTYDLGYASFSMQVDSLYFVLFLVCVTWFVLRQRKRQQVSRKRCIGGSQKYGRKLKIDNAERYKPLPYMFSRSCVKKLGGDVPSREKIGDWTVRLSCNPFHPPPARRSPGMAVDEERYDYEFYLLSHQQYFTMVLIISCFTKRRYLHIWWLRRICST